MGPMVGLDECKNSRLVSSELPARSESLYRLSNLREHKELNVK